MWIIGCRGLGREESDEWLPVGMEFLFWGDENVLELVLMIAELYKHTKPHWIVYLKRVNFMVSEIYLNTENYIADSQDMHTFISLYSVLVWAAITRIPWTGWLTQ